MQKHTSRTISISLGFTLIYFLFIYRHIVFISLSASDNFFSSSYFGSGEKQKHKTKETKRDYSLALKNFTFFSVLSVRIPEGGKEN
jgi:hypothetical protein